MCVSTGIIKSSFISPANKSSKSAYIIRNNNIHTNDVVTGDTKVVDDDCWRSERIIPVE